MNLITWTNLSGGLWSDGANWSSVPNPPGAEDIAAITLPGQYTITQNGSVTVAGLLMDDPNATLAVQGELKAGTLTLDVGTLDLLGTLDSTIVLDNGGAVQLGDGADLSNVTWRGALDITNWGSSARTFIAQGLT